MMTMDRVNLADAGIGAFGLSRDQARNDLGPIIVVWQEDPAAAKKMLAKYLRGLRSYELRDLHSLVMGALPEEGTDVLFILKGIKEEQNRRRNIRVGIGAMSTVSMAASTYHGYKRNQSVGWALVWGFFGAVAPIVTPIIALAQGYAKPK